MSHSDNSPFLRRALIADGVISGATGLLMLVAAGPLAGLLGVPADLLRAAGGSLLPFAGLLLYLSRRNTLSQASVWVVIAINAAWVAASAGLLVSGWIEPSGLGNAFIIVQAIAVALFAETQYVGLRQARARGVTIRPIA